MGDNTQPKSTTPHFTNNPQVEDIHEEVVLQIITAETDPKQVYRYRYILHRGTR
jgi:hypothetical protein